MITIFVFVCMGVKFYIYNTKHQTPYIHKTSLNMGLSLRFFFFFFKEITDKLFDETIYFIKIHIMHVIFTICYKLQLFSQQEPNQKFNHQQSVCNVLFMLYII